MSVGLNLVTARVRDAQQRLDLARRHRDRLIVEAASEGADLQVIADLIGYSRERIRQIVWGHASAKAHSRQVTLRDNDLRLAASEVGRYRAHLQSALTERAWAFVQASRNGLRQEDIAAQAGVHQTSVSRILRGAR